MIMNMHRPPGCANSFTEGAHCDPFPVGLLPQLASLQARSPDGCERGLRRPNALKPCVPSDSMQPKGLWRLGCACEAGGGAAQWSGHRMSGCSSESITQRSFGIAAAEAEAQLWVAFRMHQSCTGVLHSAAAPAPRG